MSTEQLDAELRLVFQIEPDELETNRNGYLSLMQRGRMLMDANHLFLLFVALVPVLLAGWLVGQASIEMVLGAAVFAVITGFVNQSSTKVVADVLTGRVESARGKIKIVVYTHDQRTYAGIMGKQYANGIIGEAQFIVPLEMKAYPDNEITVYYTPRYKKAVSAQAET